MLPPNRLLVCLGAKLETWFLTLREEHSVMGYGNRVVRRIFGAKGEEGERFW
jgi:hypothetical protein